MEKRIIDWQGLSDSQKDEILENAKAYLKQQVAVAKFCRVLADVHKIED